VGVPLERGRYREVPSLEDVILPLLACLVRKRLQIGTDMLLISPPENDSFRKDFCFTHDVFFLSSRDLRDAWADQLEILHDGQY